MSDQTITGKIAALDLTTREGVEQARLILAPYIHEFASVDLKTAIHGLETEEDPLKRYPHLYDVEKAYKAIEDSQRKISTPIIGVETLENLPLIDRNWLLYPLLPSAEVTLCTGQGGFGKSYLLLQIASLLTAGFNDGTLTKADIRSMTPYHYFLQPGIADPNWTAPSPVVYASYEDNLDEINRRMHYIFGRFAFAESKRSEILSNFHPVPMRQHGPLWAPDLGRHIQTRSQATDTAHQLQRICKEVQAKLLIIDPLSAGFYGDENSKAEAYAFINWWAAWGEKTKTAVLISAHLPKSTEARRSGFSGTAAWEGAVRSLFTMDRFDLNEDEDGTREKESGKNKPRKWYLALKGIKGNYAPSAKEEIPLIRGDYGWLEHTGETTLIEAQNASNEAYEATRSTAQEDRTDEEINEADIPEF